VTAVGADRTIASLPDLLGLEQIDALVFRGVQPTDRKRQVFGGQAIAQSLMAASRTIDEGFDVHSMHCYFLLPGNADIPIVFLVERVRDGRSYATRQVTARQAGRDIFVLVASFQRPERGLEHEPPLLPGLDPDAGPDVPRIPPAESLAVLEQHDGFRHPVMIAPVGQLSVASGRPTQASWIRSDAPLPDDPLLHACAIAYASDLTLLVTALLPHGLRPGTSDVMVASIDHSVWFHRPVRFDDWLLYQVESPIAGSGRALTRGEIFDRHGRLVVSTAQEGVIRIPRS
jgi:acyl-CoA thioesterase-2